MNLPKLPHHNYFENHPPKIVLDWLLSKTLFLLKISTAYFLQQISMLHHNSKILRFPTKKIRFDGLRNCPSPIRRIPSL